MTIQEELQERFSKLEQLRDELRVQIDLGKREVGDRWHAMEEDYKNLETKMKRLRDLSGEEAEKLRVEARQLAQTVRESFDRIREEL